MATRGLNCKPPPDKTISRQRSILLSHPVSAAYTLIINVAVIGLILNLVLMAIPARLLDRSAGA